MRQSWRSGPGTGGRGFWGQVGVWTLSVGQEGDTKDFPAMQTRVPVVSGLICSKDRGKIEAEREGGFRAGVLPGAPEVRFSIPSLPVYWKGCLIRWTPGTTESESISWLVTY